MKTILYTLLGFLVLCFICAISYLIYHLFPNVVTNNYSFLSYWRYDKIL